MRLIATTKVRAAKICCKRGPLIFLPNAVPIKSPARAPNENGAARSTSRFPEAAENTAPPAEMTASTPNEVATIDCTGRSV